MAIIVQVVVTRATSSIDNERVHVPRNKARCRDLGPNNETRGAHNECSLQAQTRLLTLIHAAL